MKFRDVLFKLHMTYRFDNYNCVVANNADEIKLFNKENKKYSDYCQKFNKKVQNSQKKSGIKSGYCSCCNQKVNFRWKLIPKLSENILFPETYICPKCLMYSRVRAIIHVFKILDSKPLNKTIYCYEQTTDFFDNIKDLYNDNNEVIGSEYFGADKIPGTYIDGIRHENAMDLSFSENSIDYMISNDVFEHVPNIDAALQEAKRCLKKDGKLIFHVPFNIDLEKTIRRAEIKDEKIVHYEKEEYHGGFSFENEKGCLAFYNFGCDIFDIMKKAGFSKTYAVAIQDKKFFNISIEPIVVFVCEK